MHVFGLKYIIQGIMKENTNLEYLAQKNILKVGVPMHMNGFKYLYQAIVLALENLDIIYSITKEVYPAIASANGVSPQSVEKCMRHAIEAACFRGNQNMEFLLQQYTLGGINKRPTNSEFIGIMAWKTGLEYKE